MKPITLREVAAACNGTLHGDPEIQITSIVTDSRQAKAGSLFAAIRGARADGHRFIPMTVEQGAACALCEEAPEVDAPYILVESTLVALKGIAAYYRSLFTIPFIGITGSVGKTSTKEFISTVLAQKYKVHKTSGNFNNELGVPITLFGLEEDHEVAVIEMGISGFGEMTRLSKMVRPDISVITNIGYCHLENLGDRDGVLKAKTEMFTYLKENGTIILCHDDDKLSTVTEYKGIRPIFYGTGDEPFRAENIVEKGFEGIDCTLIHDNMRIDVTLPTMGRHNVLNALCAMTVGVQLGLTADEIRRGLESFHNVGARNKVVKTEALTVIDDSYNANPDSTASALRSLGRSQGARKVAILGDMGELGSDGPRLHYDTGCVAAESGADVVLCCGELARQIAEGAKAGGVSEVHHYATLAPLLEEVSGILRPGDCVLVKASHSMQFERVIALLEQL